MGYEIDSVEKVEVYNKDTGEKIGEFEPFICYTEEDPAVDNPKVTTIKNDAYAEFTCTTAALEQPPVPNIMFIISPGRKDGKYATKICFYRPKEYNWFQRFMYKICFGITIKQGNEVRRVFL